MTASLMPNGKQQFFNTTTGAFLVGGKVYTYAAGTTTPKATYTTAAATVSNANPVILDARGEATIFWSGSYKVAVYDANNVLIYTIDNYTAQTDASVIPFLQSGTGAVESTVQTKLREFISVKDYGAVGNGIADDTVACQAAIDAVYVNGGVLYFPPGTYNVTTLTRTFSATISITVQGSGQASTIIQQIGVASAPVFDWIIADAALGVVYWQFRDMRINGNGASLGSCIKLHHTSRGLIENCYLGGGFYGLLADGAEQFLVSNTMIRSNNVGVYAKLGAAAINVCNLITFYKTTFVSNVVGADLKYANGCVFDGCVFEVNGTSGVMTTGAILIEAEYGSQPGFGNLTINDCWFEHNYGRTLSVEAGAGGLALTRVAIYKTFFINNYDYGAYILRCRNFTIKDSNFATATDNVLIDVAVQSTELTNSTIYTLSDSSPCQYHYNIGTSATTEKLRINNFYQKESNNYIAIGGPSDSVQLLEIKPIPLSVSQVGGIAITGTSSGATYNHQMLFGLDGGGVTYASMQKDNVEYLKVRSGVLSLPTNTITTLPTYSNTTATAANVNIDSGGILYRSTSSARFKTDIENLSDEEASKVLNFRPVWYRSTCAGDNKEWSWYGFLAEEVAEIDPRYVNWGHEKTHSVEVSDGIFEEQVDLDSPLIPDGVQYERMVVPLIAIVKKQQKMIESLSVRLDALESK